MLTREFTVEDHVRWEREDAKEEGLEEGREEKRLEIVAAMLKEGLGFDLIAKIAKMPIAEVERLSLTL